MVQDVEVTVLAFGNKDVELKVVVAVLFIAEEKDLVVAISEVTALGTVEVGNNAVFSRTRIVAPSGPPVITMSDSVLGNLVANSVVLERIEDQHLVIALQRDFEVIDVILRSGSILRREEVHGAKNTVGGVFAEAVQAPLPFGHQLFIEIELGHVIVGIDMHAEVHPFVVDARQVAGAIATGVNRAVARGLGRVLPIVGHVQIDLHGPSAVGTSKVVQHIKVTVLAFGNVGIEFEVVDTR